MSLKYKFTGETRELNGKLLQRIQRISDGVLGGWIKSEDNLSHDGNCWVGDNAVIFDDVMVDEEARVYGKAQVYIIT